MISFQGLIIGKPEEFQENQNLDKVIKYPDGKEAIYIIRR